MNHRITIASGILALGLAALIGCSSNGPGPVDAARDAPGGDGTARPDAVGPSEAGDRRVERALDLGRPDAPIGLPFTYTRPPAGTPLSAAELTALTDLYLDLLKKTGYFKFVDERVHGWPQSDPKKRYWYGVWGAQGIHRKSGKVIMHHGFGPEHDPSAIPSCGEDNDGIPTAAVLEGACFAYKQWPSPERELLVRRLMRGLRSWIMAMERQAADPASPLLARAAFPESIDSTDGGRSFFIDYSHCRSDDPQLDTYVDTVHIPANPTWGDLYIRNKRSKDDIGHMLRAIATVGDCAASFTADAQADYAAMKASYSQWCQRVEADGWGIATLDNNANLYMPPITSTMSWFYGLGNAECDAMISIRLLGHGDPGTFSCGNGIHPLEQLAMTNDHNGGIVRAFHEAAVRNALAFNQAGVAQSMLAGLAQRVEDGLTAFEANKLPVWLGAGSLALLIIESANTGLPLTWREVRYIHKQIEIARDQYLNKTDPVLYKLFDASTGDGEYPYEPDPNGAIELSALGTLLGTCVSIYRNPAGMPALDCARVKSWTP